MDRPNLYFGIFIFLLSLIQGMFLLPDYGMNWDEPAHYLRGQAYLHFFLTGRKDYKDLPQLKSHFVKSKFSKPPFYDNVIDDDSSFRRSIYQYDRGEGEKFTYSYFIKNDKGHPPINGILASFSNYIFYQKLGILGDLESYHLFTVAISSLLVASVFLFTSHFYGRFAGIIAALSLLLFPLFFAESHFNIKDPVEATFYSLTIFAFYLGVAFKKWYWILISAIFAGFALGTKFNIFFAGATIILWLTIYQWHSIKSKHFPFAKLITLTFLLYPLISLAILFISWPYLWQNPIGNLTNIFLYYREIGLTSYQVNNYYFFGLNTYSIQWFLFSTPLVILFLLPFGVLRSLKKGLSEKGKLSILILLWFLIPFIRVSASDSGIYGGLRQIMEFIPAMAILAGIGASYIVQSLKLKMQNDAVRHPEESASWRRLKDPMGFFTSLRMTKVTFIFELLIILLFVPITLKLISIHPNENVYFNPLIGGIAGAKERNFADWGVTLGSVYNQGLDWLNENAPKNSNLALIKGLHSNIPKTKLRSDINFDNRYYSADMKEGEYIMEVIDYRWKIDIDKNVRSYLLTLAPAYEVKIDDVSILTIWKND